MSLHSGLIWKQALPLSPDVKKINPNGVAALAKDVAYLAEFVDSLDNAMILKENLDELQQTVHLMQTDNPDEFYDTSLRNKKFGRVDAMNGPIILEKYDLYNTGDSFLILTSTDLRILSSRETLVLQISLLDLAWDNGNQKASSQGSGMAYILWCEMKYNACLGLSLYPSATNEGATQSPVSI